MTDRFLIRAESVDAVNSVAGMVTSDDDLVIEARDEGGSEFNIDEKELVEDLKALTKGRNARNQLKDIIQKIEAGFYDG